MGFFDFCKSILLYIALPSSLPVVEDYEGSQHLLPEQQQDSIRVHSTNHHSGLAYPSFAAPGSSQYGAPFICEYPSMAGWVPCSTEADRSCWLQGPEGFNITTKYEISAPTGVTREVRVLF